MSKEKNKKVEEISKVLVIFYFQKHESLEKQPPNLWCFLNHFLCDCISESSCSNKESFTADNSTL